MLINVIDPESLGILQTGQARMPSLLSYRIG